MKERLAAIYRQHGLSPSDDTSLLLAFNSGSVEPYLDEFGANHYCQHLPAFFERRPVKSDSRRLVADFHSCLRIICKGTTGREESLRRMDYRLNQFNGD